MGLCVAIQLILYVLLMSKEKKPNSVLKEISCESCIKETDWTNVIIRVSTLLKRLD